jgi:hypothetical protein
MAVIGPVSVEYADAATAVANGNFGNAPHFVEMRLTGDELQRMGATPVQANGLDVHIRIEPNGGRVSGAREVVISNLRNETRSIWVSGFPLIEVDVITGQGYRADIAASRELFERTCLATRLEMVNKMLPAWGFPHPWRAVDMGCEADKNPTQPKLQLVPPPGARHRP